MEASLRKARALRLRFSQSLASRRHRFNDEKVSKTQGRRCYASPRPVGSREAKFDFRYAATDFLRQQGARFDAWRPLSLGWMVCPTWSGSFRIRRARMAVTSGVLPAAPVSSDLKIASME
jgi:hypothetical protein